jgi:hypothetical protein
MTMHAFARWEQRHAVHSDICPATRVFRACTPLTHYELGQSLGLDRFETDALLKCHEVTEHSITHEDVDADVKSLNELRTLSS